MKINIKKIILTILTITVVIFAGVWLFDYFQNENINENGTPRDRDLFPFGEIFPGSRDDGDTEGVILDEDGNVIQRVDDDEVIVEGIRPQLQLITNKPTGGFIPIKRIEELEVVEDITQDDGSFSQETTTIEVEQSIVRYSDIESGTVYETPVTGDRAFFETKVVDNVIPNAEHAYFSHNGDHVAFQYWDQNDRSAETYLASIERLSLDIEPCSYTFEGNITIGEESEFVFQLHQFLNMVPGAQLASSGINSPGNESPLATETTIDALKRFQTKYELTADGALGPRTRAVMLDVCNEQEEQEAQKRLEAQDTQYEIFGRFLAEGIVSINMHPNENTIFYLEADNGGAIGSLLDLENQEQSTIFTSPFSSWLSSWNNPLSIELQTKPSFDVQNYSYNLDTESGDYRKSFQERNGLMTLPSPDDSKLLVFDTDLDRPRLSIYERDANRFIPLSTQSFTDKCVWSSDSVDIYCAVPDALGYGQEYPDSWFQGLETYSDSLWRINTVNFQEELISDIRNDYLLSIDVEKIDIDEDNGYLFFIDKNTESLWSYRIDEV